MKIRLKLFLSFIMIACLSALLATFFAIYSISGNYEEIAYEEMEAAKREAENKFYEYLGELTRKAVFISELSEIVDNLGDPEELFIALESKGFFLYNINAKILSPDFKILVSFDNSSPSVIGLGNVKSLPFFASDRDPLLRDTGVFYLSNQVCVLTVAPIVDQRSFDFKGYLLFETYLNHEFADQLKEKASGEIVIMSLQDDLATSFQDMDGRRFFPKIPDALVERDGKVRILEERYLLRDFPVRDYYEKTVGRVRVAVDTKNIVIAKEHGIKNILWAFLLIIILVIVASLVVGRKLTRPILVLSRGAELITAGEYDVQTKTTSRDEFGHLLNVFNNMAESLKNQREEILDLKLFFEKIINHAPSAIFICDDMGKVITMNPAAEKILAVNSENILGLEIFDAINLSPSIKADFYKVLFSGNPAFYDSYPLFLANNEERIFRLTLYKIILKKSVSVAIQIEDVTERFQMEEELTHAKKLGTLGEALTRFTHEFNNLLAGILGQSQLLKSQLDKGERYFSKVASIEDLATKALNLSRNILSFSKKEKFETEYIDVKSMLRSVLNLIEKTVLRDVQVSIDLTDGPFMIVADKERLSLVLFNLLINAKDAIKDTNRKGEISIQVDRDREPKSGETVVRIRIIDNGSGIDDENLKKIFLPYFTTKGKSGTGLGLSTVQQIVEKSNGTISVESRLDVGTIFTIRLPQWVSPEDNK